jgi:hypothetical protein
VRVDVCSLEDRGYTTTRLLDDAAVDELRTLWAGLAVPEDDPYFTSSIHTDRETARSIDLRMKAVLGPALAEALPGYAPFLASFIFKGAHSGSVELHPDWTYTDERSHRTYLFWCPLVDTDAENGTLHVVPGSHRWVTGLRGSGDFAEATTGVEDLLGERAVTVPLRSGEAIVYDAALIHGSPPNRTDRPRPVAAVATAPESAGLVHFHRPPGGPTQGYAIDEAWYTVQPFGEPPTGYPALEPWTEPMAPIRPEQVLAPG